GDSFGAGIDKRTGRNLWKVKRPRGINWVSPIVFPWAGRTAALFQTENEATAHDARTGEVLWGWAGRGPSPIKSACCGEGLVFLAGDRLVALKPRGEQRAPKVVRRAGNLSQGYASPVYHRGRVYYLTPVSLVCLNASDGQEVWKRRVDGPFDASPVIADGKFYAVNNRGRTSVVRLGDEPKLLARNDLEDAIGASPAVASGHLFFRSDGAVYCVGRGE